MTIEVYQLSVVGILFAFAAAAVLFARHSASRLEQDDLKTPPAE